MNPTLHNLLREPLLHFMGLGVCLFIATNEVSHDNTSAITITEAHKNELIEQFQHQYHYRPTYAEQKKLIANAIEEEVLYREGISYELDKYDPIVKNRVVQKMHFVIEGMATPKQPTIEDLQHYLEQNSDQFQSSESYSFEHVFFAKDSSTPRNETKIDILKSLQAEKHIESDPFILGNTFEMLSSTDIEQRFGRAFSQELARNALLIESEPGDNTIHKRWFGPVNTRFGEHFVRITELQPPKTQPLSAVHHAVYSAWSDEKSRQNLQSIKQRIISNYTIEQPLPEPSDAYAMQ